VRQARFASAASVLAGRGANLRSNGVLHLCSGCGFYFSINPHAVSMSNYAHLLPRCLGEHFVHDKEHFL
jgi:hypothetical protein